MAAMAMEAMVVTGMARGLLMPMPTTAMAAMVLVTATAVATDMARGLLMPTMAADTDMVVTATAVAMPGASKSKLVKGLPLLLLNFHDTHRNQAKINSFTDISARN